MNVTTDRRFVFSNFEPVEGLVFEGQAYPTSEHLFQALKTDNPEWREQVRTARTPGAAKQVGRRVPLRPNWNNEKRGLMERVLKLKFALEPFQTRLLAWEGPIIEFTTWHDTYWGVCICPRHNGEGKNVLGTLLEELRDTLRATVKE